MYAAVAINVVVDHDQQAIRPDRHVQRVKDHMHGF
jgi:hypothetical protein